MVQVRSCYHIDHGYNCATVTRGIELTCTGLGLGAFFSLMSASFAYEDPLSKASQQLGTKAQTAYMFKEMGRNMWSTGKGFAKVGALYSGVECCIEGVSAVHSSEPVVKSRRARNRLAEWARYRSPHRLGCRLPELEGDMS